MSTEESKPEAESTPEPVVKSTEERNLEAHEVPEVLDFLRENGMSILVGVGLAVAVFLGWSAYRNYKASANASASDALFRAQTADDIQKIITQYPSSSAAPLAYLALASAQFDAGQYDMADHVFAEFQQKYPAHSLAQQAEIGRALCKEASGQLNEALGAFDAFAASYTNHYLTPVALFGKARTLEQLGRFPEAKAVYEDYIALGQTNSPWTSRAEAALLYVDKEARAAKLPPVTNEAPKLAPMVVNPGLTPTPAALPTPAPAAASP